MSSFLRKVMPHTGLDETVRRFPLSVICAFLVFGVWLFSPKNDAQDSYLSIFGLACIFLYFWCGAVALFSEARGYSFKKNLIISFAGCSFILALLFSPIAFNASTIWLIPFFLLLIMASPFLSMRDDNAYFWQFNCALWTGVINAISASFALCLGLMAAAASVIYLFGFKDADIVFGHIFFFCSGLVAPIYALFWVPRSSGVGIAEIPQHCRILVNWVLVPLMAVYLIIFYAYFLKIMVEWELPKGMLSGMIAGLGCLGVVIYMMAWPMVREGSRLLKFLHRHFFKLMLIPTLMFMVALSIRIHQYGITEQRYMLLILLIWFGVISGLFLTKKDVPLKVVPIVLMVLLLMASFGPWGAVAVSGKSQAQRLEDILIRNGILNEVGVIVPSQGRVSYKDEEDISSILDYMQSKRYRHHLPEQLMTILDNPSVSREYWNQSVREAMAFMGLEYKNKYDKALNAVEGDSFFITLQKDARRVSAINVQGYRHVLKSKISIDANPEQGGHENIATRHQEFMRQDVLQKYDIVLKNDGKLILTVENYPALVFDLQMYARPYLSDGLRPKVKDMTIVSSNKRLKVELDLRAMSGFVKDGVVQVTRVNGDLIIYFK